MGRRIWILDTYEGVTFSAGPFRVESFKQFLPAGPTKKVNFEGQLIESGRKKSLVQVWTDGGMRTAAVASIWGRDPSKNTIQW